MIIIMFKVLCNLCYKNILAGSFYERQYLIISCVDS